MSNKKLIQIPLTWFKVSVTIQLIIICCFIYLFMQLQSTQRKKQRNEDFYEHTLSIQRSIIQVAKDSIQSLTKETQAYKLKIDSIKLKIENLKQKRNEIKNDYTRIYWDASKYEKYFAERYRKGYIGLLDEGSGR